VRRLESGGVRAQRQIDAGFRIVTGLLIVLGEALSNFGGGGPDDGIEIGIVVGVAAKDLNSQGTFLEFSGMSIQRALHDVAQEGGISLAVFEERVGEYPFELGLNFSAPDFGFGHGGPNHR
jgi:hypothetical protein